MNRGLSRYFCISVCVLCMCLFAHTVRANNPPVAVDDGPFVDDEDPDNPIAGSVANDFDPDPGDAIVSYSVKVEPVHGTLVSFDEVGGTFQYQPDPDWNGTDYFTYKPFDGDVESVNIGKVTLKVNPLEDVPEPDDQSLTTQMNVPIQITLSAVSTDKWTDPDTVDAYEITSSTNGTPSATDSQTFTFTPTVDFTGDAVIKFRAQDTDLNWSDANGIDNDTPAGYADGTVTVTVTNDLKITGVYPSGYALEQHPITGDTYYNDRTYILRYLPESFKDDQYYLIKTNNDDKYVSDTSFLKLDVNQGVRVYIGYDVRASAIPGWMTTAGFTVSSITAGIAGSEGGGSRMVLYEQDYTDNRIVLGGNDGLTTGAQSNYVLIIKSLTSGIGSLEANQLPVAVADSDVAAVTLGTAVNFDATGSSDPEDTTVGIWSWDFGDGTGTSAAESPAYTYPEIGTYCAVLTVTDGSGGSSRDSVTITVNEVPANEVQITGVGPSSFSAERLFRGSQLYTDRSYTIISMPDLIEGKKGIRTVNDYKTSTSSGLLAFTVDEDVTLYVLYDQDRTTLPSWLSGFTDVGDVVTSAATMDVLESPSTYPAGQILLGGNHSGSGDGLQNYVVLVDGASDDSCGTSVSENGWYYKDDTDGDGLPDWFETGKLLDTYTVDTNGDTIMDEDEDNGSSSTYFAEWQVIKNTKEEKKDAGGGGGCVPGPVSGLPLAGLLAAAVFGLAIIRLRRK